jgi:hypothetical protein
MIGNFVSVFIVKKNILTLDDCLEDLLSTHYLPKTFINMDYYFDSITNKNYILVPLGNLIGYEIHPSN